MPGKANEAPQQTAGILKEVRNPLGFFALSLLIIEAIMGLLVGLNQIADGYKFVVICMMIGVFLIVVIVVSIITIKYPDHFYEGIVKKTEESLKQSQILVNQYFESSAFEDLVKANIKRIMNEKKKKKKGGRNG